MLSVQSQVAKDGPLLAARTFAEIAGHRRLELGLSAQLTEGTGHCQATAEQHPQHLKTSALQAAL
jgi:hypothetical protein